MERFVLKGNKYNPIFIDTDRSANDGWIHILSYEEVVSLLNKYSNELRTNE